MTKPIVLTQENWYHLYDQLKKDYPIETFLLRSRMKSVLGFVHREYSYWEQGSRGSYLSRTDVRLDFYDEPKRTMFLLKYGEFLEK